MSNYYYYDNYKADNIFIQSFREDCNRNWRGLQRASIQSILLDAKAPLPNNFSSSSKWWMINETFKGIRKKYQKSDDEISKLIMEFLDPRNHGLEKDKAEEFQKKIREIIELDDVKNTTIGKDFLLFTDDKKEDVFLDNKVEEKPEDEFAFLDNYNEEELKTMFDQITVAKKDLGKVGMEKTLENLVKVAEIKNVDEVIRNFNKQDMVKWSINEKIYMLKVLFSYFEAIISSYRGNGMFFLSSGIDDLNDCYKVLRKKIIEVVNSDEIFSELKNTDAYKGFVEENKSIYPMSEYLDVLWDDAVLPALILIREEIADKDLFENNKEIHPSNQVVVDFLNLINKEIQSLNKTLALHNKRFEDTDFSKIKSRIFAEQKPVKEEVVKHEHKHYHENVGADKPQKIEIVGSIIIPTKNVANDAIDKNSGEKIYPLKFKPTDWSDITIKFINEEDVFISIGKNGKQNDGKQTDYEALGFKNTTTGKPDKLWQFLLLLSMKNGFLSLGGNVPDKIRKTKSKLSNNLQKIFQNRTDPFDDFDFAKGYKILITLIPPPDLKPIPERNIYSDE